MNQVGECLNKLVPKCIKFAEDIFLIDRQEVVNMTVWIVKHKILPFVYGRDKFILKRERKRQNKQRVSMVAVETEGSGLR